MCPPKQRSADVAWLVQLAVMGLAVVVVAWFVIAHLAVLAVGLVAVVVVTVVWLRFLRRHMIAAWSGRLRPIVAASAAPPIQPPAQLPVRERAAIVARPPAVLEGVVIVPDEFQIYAQEAWR